MVLGAIFLPRATPITRLFFVGFSLVGYSFALNRLIRRLASGAGPKEWRTSSEPMPVLTPDSDEGAA
jgi:hypothetical protein